MNAFGSLMTAMATPFDADGKVDFQKAHDLARLLLAEGSDSLLVAGTTGESPTLNHAEKLTLFRAVKKAAGTAPVLAGTGTNDTATSIALTREATECGVDGILVVSPYYNKPPQEGLYQHFRAVAQATTLPVVIYNIPGRTGVNLETVTLQRLARIPNVKAVKEASGNLDQVSEIARSIGASGRALAPRPLAHAASPVRDGLPATPRHDREERGETPTFASQAAVKEFSIYSGDDSLTLPILSVGGCGVISVASHVAGPEIKRMISAYLNGQVSEAAALHARLHPIFRGLFATTNPILVKAALRLRGFDAGTVRPPLVEATPEQIEHLRSVMLETGLLS